MTPTDRNPPVHAFKATLAILGVALTGVLLLFAIGRTHWFHLRPASGSAAAMGHAAAAPDAPRAATPAPVTPRG